MKIEKIKEAIYTASLITVSALWGALMYKLWGWML